MKSYHVMFFMYYYAPVNEMLSIVGTCIVHDYRFIKITDFNLE